MAVNAAKTYSQNVVNAFTLASITQGMSGNGWNWAAEQGKTIVLTSNGTAPMTDYTRTGTSRYGTPAEIDNTQQEIACAKDRAFTFTIDKMGRTERAMTIEANAQLRKQIDEVVTAEIDKYTLANLCSQAKAANVVDAAATVDKSNAYETFLELNSLLDDELVPTANRVAWVSPAFYNMLKLDESFTKASESTVKALTSGFLGDVDGVALVKAPTSYLPAKDSASTPSFGETLCVIAHKDAWVQPIRLETYKTHQDPPGIDGWLVEGRIVYDAFVLERNVNGVATKNGVAVLRQKLA